MRVILCGTTIWGRSDEPKQINIRDCQVEMIRESIIICQMFGNLVGTCMVWGIAIICQTVMFTFLPAPFDCIIFSMMWYFFNFLSLEWVKGSVYELNPSCLLKFLTLCDAGVLHFCSHDCIWRNVTLPYSLLNGNMLGPSKGKRRCRR